MPFSQPYVANPYPYAYAQTLTSANTLYDIAQSLVAGVYTISWSGGGTITIDFYNGTTLVGTATGTSPITFNLAQSITNYKMWNTVAGTSVVISLSGLALATVSGTLYTYTTSQTITLTGDGYCVLVGGGGGGGGGNSGGTGGGGGSGGIISGRIQLTGSLSLTIGTGGLGMVGNGTIGNGTPTTLGALTANGGGGGTFTTSTGGAGLAGTPNGGAGGATSTNLGISASSNSNYLFSFLTMGTTGGGAGAGATPGQGSGIGTGGAGQVGTVGNPGTGYGSGGAGVNSGGSISTGGNGASGVCYIIL